MTPQERIKADAEAYMHAFVKGSVKYEDIIPNDIKNAHIAGATAENERAQVLVDALEFVKNNGLCSETTEMINNALEQWKSGKGKDEPKPVASNCGMCGKLGKNQYLGNQLYLCDECFEDYEKGRDQPV